MKNKNNSLDFSYKKPPKIIAEISGNHNGNKLRFLNLVKKACESEADLIKRLVAMPMAMATAMSNLPMQGASSRTTLDI